MALPENFSEWENLQDLVRLDHNKAVRDYFKNQPDDDISTPKARLKHTCFIKDEDTSVMTFMRMWLFEITCGRAQAIQRPVYGIPVEELQANVKFKPQVKLYFLEPYDPHVHDSKTHHQAEGEITFRLMNESSESISRSEAETLARAIKAELATPPLIWEKGWFKCTYLDPEHGYDMRLLVKNKTEGEKIVRKVIGVRNHPFDRDYFQFIEHDRSYPVNPGTHRVYGRQRNKSVKRRRADVKFKYAQLLIWGMPNPINLVSVGGTRLRSVIERV
jgi:hypothetical protein